MKKKSELDEFMGALNELEQEKGIRKETLLEAIEVALISAYKKHFGNNQEARVEIDPDTGEVRVYSVRTVVEELSEYENEDDQASEILLSEAQEKIPDIEVGDIFEAEVTPRDFGRIAAQTAKQVVVQRIREAERGIIYDKFADKENSMLKAVVHRLDRGSIYVELEGHAEGIIPAAEAVPNERLSVNDQIRVFVLEVKRTNRGPQIIVSRTHPALIHKLFEREVPEIMDRTVEVKSIAREAGARTKIAVASREKNVDPVGACVGPKGVRIERVVEELNGEKIDVIPWSDDPIEFIANALRPAKVLMVQINEEEQSARVIVPDYQLSLAIGKEGQNARLAAKLTGWKIDIKSKSQADQEMFGDDSEYDAEEDRGSEPLNVPESSGGPFDLIDSLNAEEDEEEIEQDLILDDFLNGDDEDAAQPAGMKNT